MVRFPGRRNADPNDQPAAPNLGEPASPPPVREGTLARVRYFFEDAWYAIRSGGSGAVNTVRDGWFGLPLERRRRIAAGGGGAAALLFVILVLGPSAPCQLPGGKSCPADNEAIELVPDDALGYLHVNLDADTEQGRLARDVALRVPTLVGEVLDRFQAGFGSNFSFDRQVGPWFGGEGALAVLPGGRSGVSVLMLETSDPDASRDFAAQQLQTGGVQTAEYEGIQIGVDGGGTGAAVVGGFLVVGPENEVRSVIDAAAGASLADVAQVDDVLDELPDLRFAEGYASERGAATLLGGTQLDVAVNIDATEAVGFAAIASEEGIAFETASRLDPDRAEQAPGFFGALPVFEPKLDEAVPGDALAYLGLGEPGESIAALLDQAGSTAPGILAGFQRLQKDLNRRAGVNLQREILPLLGDEVAISIEQEPLEEAADGQLNLSAPYLSVIAEGVDESGAREALARLQGPLAEAAGSSRQAPGTQTTEIEGVETNILSLSPTLNLTYAVFDGRLAIATDPAGVEDAIKGGGGLRDEPRFEEAVDELPDEVSALLYLELERLIALAEQAGLAAVPEYSSFAADVRLLQAAGLSFRQRDGLLEADLRLTIDDAQAEDPADPAEEPVIGEPPS